MNKIKCNCLFIIFCILTLTCIMGVTNISNNIVYAQEIDEPIFEKELEYDSVIVVLDSSISEVNKVHSKDFFGGLEIDYIKDLTYRNYNKTVNSDFKQILQIYLQNKTRESILYAIEVLEKLSGILSVEVNDGYSLADSAMEVSYDNSNKFWGLKEEIGIDATTAWGIVTGSKNVKVGIIDSGIEEHTDLAYNVTTGYDFYNSNTVTSDDDIGHGTQVAGIIGATWNEVMAAGVCKDVTLVPLQVHNMKGANEGYISASATIDVINWAQDVWGTSEQIDILNYSVSGFGEYTCIRQAVAQYNGLFV